jgi:outer membrane protein TolC
MKAAPMKRAGVAVSRQFRANREKEQTIGEALAAAYADNPEINSARAQTRVTDEGVPLALSGYRPIISLFTTSSVARSGAASTGYTTSANATVG